MSNRIMSNRVLQLGGLKINVEVEFTQEGPPGTIFFDAATVVGCEIRRFPGGNCPGVVTHVTGESHGSLLIACLTEVVDSYIDDHQEWPYEEDE